jgi:hypothetical protein
MKKLSGLTKSAVLTMIALAIGFVASCASSPTLTDETPAQWNAAVKKHIPDAQRANKLTQYGQQLFAVQKSLSQDIAALDENALELNANYASTREEARQMVANFTQKRNAALAQYRDIIFAMRREVSVAEWKALTD